MVLGNSEPIFLDGKEIVQVDRFKYLGSVIGIDGDSTPEISVRLAIARDTTNQLLGLWKANEISLQLKKQLKSVVSSVALYCSEIWTVKEPDKRI